MVKQFSDNRAFRFTTLAVIALVIIASFIYIVTSHNNSKTHVKPAVAFKVRASTVALVNSFNDISCPTQSVCYALGTSVFDQNAVIAKTTDSGKIWTDLTIPKETTESGSIVCPTSNECAATVSAFMGLAGEVLTTQDGGLTWTASTSPPNHPLLSSLSCINLDYCLASIAVVTDGNILKSTHNFGQTWKDVKITGNNIGLSLNPITYCFSASFCLVSGTDSVPNTKIHLKHRVNNLRSYIGYINSTENTVNYIQLPGYISIVTSISCATIKMCFAVGMADSNVPVILKTSNFFKTFEVLKLPFEVGSAANISCDDKLNCLITGGYKSNSALALDFNALNNSVVTLNPKLPNVPDLTIQTCNKYLTSCMIGGSNQRLTFTAIDSLKLVKTMTNEIRLKPYNPQKQHIFRSYKNMLLVGDSTATVMSIGLQMNQLNFGYVINDGSIVGCGLVTNSPIRYTGKTGVTASNCFPWQQDYRQSVANSDPYLTVMLIGPWDVISRMLNGTFQHVGDPEYNQLFISNLKQAISILSQNGSKVVILNSPYFYHGLMSDLLPWPQDDPTRVNSLNKLEDQVAGQFPNVRIVNFGGHISSNGEYLRVIHGVEIRTPDGIHFTDLGAIYESNWIMSQINKLNWNPKKTPSKSAKSTLTK